MFCMVQLVFRVDDALFFLIDLELVMFCGELAVSVSQLSVGLANAFAKSNCSY